MAATTLRVGSPGVWTAVHPVPVGLMMTVAREAGTSRTCVTFAGLEARRVHKWEFCHSPLEETKDAIASDHKVHGYNSIPIPEGDEERVWQLAFCTAGGPGQWVRAKDAAGVTINSVWAMPREDSSPVAPTCLPLLPAIRGGWVPMITVERLERTTAVMQLVDDIAAKHHEMFHTPPRSPDAGPPKCPDAPARAAPISRRRRRSESPEGLPALVDEGTVRDVVYCPDEFDLALSKMEHIMRSEIHSP